MNRAITEIFFSPGGTTKKISRAFCEFSNSVETIDLLRKDVDGKKLFSENDFVVVSIPVFAGRIPEIALKKLKQMQGNGTAAVALVAYGNRAYDDALLELCDLLRSSGFTVFGAAAFIARHSIFPKVASNRPDSTDIEEIHTFSAECVKKLKNGVHTPLAIRGNNPYRPYGKPLPILPKGNSDCTKCGVCAKICPMNAISSEKPRKTDKTLCIRCAACIYNCPVNARAFGGMLYKIAELKFQKNYSDAKKTEMFL